MYVLNTALAKAEKKLTSLCRCLDLADNQFDDIVILGLIKHKIFEKVQILNLSDNQITDKGFEYLKAHLTNPENKNSLRYLLLNNNFITLENLEEISKEIKMACPNLVHIDFSGNCLIMPPFDKDISEEDLPEMFENTEINKFLHKEKNSNENFLSCSLRFHSVMPLRVKSVFDPSKEFLPSEGIVCLLHLKGDFKFHSYLGIEYLCGTGQRRLIITDLLVNENNKINIRIHIHTPEKISNKYKKSILKDSAAIVKKELIVNQLLPKIFESQKISEFKQYKLFPGSEEGVLNCFKWIAEDLLPCVEIKREYENYIPKFENGFCFIL